MPVIKQYHEINVSPNKFLENCSPEELYETMLLLESPRYQNQIIPIMYSHNELPNPLQE